MSCPTQQANRSARPGTQKRWPSCSTPPAPQGAEGSDAQPPRAADAPGQRRVLEILDRESVVLAMLPLFHVFGLNAVLGSWAMSGARLVIMDGYDGFADVLAGEAITNCCWRRRC